MRIVNEPVFDRLSDGRGVQSEAYLLQDSNCASKRERSDTSSGVDSLKKQRRFFAYNLVYEVRMFELNIRVLFKEEVQPIAELLYLSIGSTYFNECAACKMQHQLFKSLSWNKNIVV